MKKCTKDKCTKDDIENQKKKQKKIIQLVVLKLPAEMRYKEVLNWNSIINL